MFGSFLSPNESNKNPKEYNHLFFYSKAGIKQQGIAGSIFSKSCNRILP